MYININKRGGEKLLNTENEISVKKQLKDSLFTRLFKDIKYLKKLYSALYNDIDKYKDEDFKLITLENTLVYDVYNDLGLLVKDKLILLVEAQSTYNPNMALRLLVYIANTYYNYILDNSLNIYGTTKVELPTPEFILVYTGKRKFESNVLKLSDSYIHGKEIPLELIVKIITNENQEHSILWEYISFCQKYDSLKEGMKTKQEIAKALKETIRYCKTHNILKEFLEINEREVEEIIMSVFTQEQATTMVLNEKYNEGLAYGLEQGLERGLEQGLEQGITTVAKSLKNSGMDMDLIIKYTGLTKEQIMKL